MKTFILKISGGGEFSLNFSAVKSKIVKPFPGMMVDVRFPRGPREGIVSSVKEIGKDKYTITTKVTGMAIDMMLIWPGNIPDFCGALLPLRNCENKSKDP